MAIFSKIKKAVSKAYGAVSNFATKVGNSLAKNSPNNYTASVANMGLNPGKTVYYTDKGVPYQTNTINAVSVPKGLTPGTSAYNAYVASNPKGSTISSTTYGNSGNSVTQPSYSGKAPVTISAGPQKVSSGGGQPTNLLGATAYQSESPTIQRTALTGSTGGSIGGTTGTSAPMLGSTTGGGSTSPVVLPPRYTSTNPQMDNTKSPSLFKKWNAQKGEYEDVEDPNAGEETDEETVGNLSKLFKEQAGMKESVFDDPEVKQAREERQRIREAIQVPTNELNAVIAKQNADLLAHRKMISENGGTETGFGGVEAAINYNAAIRALPLKASIAGLQGDLELAQDYLNELTEVKREQINNQYDYKMKLLNAIVPALDKKRERKYQEKKAEWDRAYAEAMDLNDYKSNIAATVLKNNPGKDLSSVMTRIGNATDKMSIVSAAGQYLASPNTEIRQLDNGNTVIIDKNTGTIVSNLGGAKAAEVLPGENPQLYSGLSTGTATAVRSIVGKYGSEPTIQNFATIQDGRNFAQSINTKTKNPADDQALIYSLAKALDPGSVVREGEYATAQKYAQSWVSTYGKGVTQALAGTGFLSETARTNIKKTIEQKYNSAKVSYDKQYKEYVGQINNLTGRSDGEKFLRSYVTESTGGGSDIDYTATLDSIFK